MNHWSSSTRLDLGTKSQRGFHLAEGKQVIKESLAGRYERIWQRISSGRMLISSAIVLATTAIWTFFSMLVVLITIYFQLVLQRNFLSISLTSTTFFLFFFQLCYQILLYPFQLHVDAYCRFSVRTTLGHNQIIIPLSMKSK